MKSKWPPFHIVINLTAQNLQLFYSNKESWIYGDERWSQMNIIKDLFFETKISSAEKGFGQAIDSLQTPLGRHYIRAKIGGGYKENSALLPINNYAWSKLGGESSVKLLKNSLDYLSFSISNSIKPGL